jgi:integrase
MASATGHIMRNAQPKKMKKIRLTDRSIQAARPPRAGDQTIVYDSHEPGMALRTMASGHKSFVFVGRFPPSTNPTRRSLGSYAGPRAEPVPPEDALLDLSVLTLAQAREKARLWRRLIQRGIDPDVEARRRRSERETRERQIAADSFEAVARRFIAEHVAGKRTAQDIAALIEAKLVSHWGARPIIGISKRDVIDRIEDIKRTSGNEAARQALAYARVLFGWAMERDIIAASPCPVMSKRSKLLAPKTMRQRVLDNDEIKLIWRATEANLYPADPFLRLLLILGCRRNELARAHWREFDLRKPGAETWTLKGERTKTGDPRIVPLPAMAAGMIAALPRFAAGDFVFSALHGRRPFTAFSRMKATFDGKIRKLNGGVPLEQWGLHDLRRSMRTRLSALPIAPIVSELMIGHRQQGIAAVYDLHRYEAEQRHGYELWCARLRDIVEPPPQNVVRLPAATEARA